MIDLSVIEKHGGTAEKLKAKFETPKEKRSAKLNEFIEHSASRIHDGVKQCQRDAHFWWAIDRAYDVSRRQISYTLVEGLLDKKPSQAATVLAAAKSWGLEDMLVPAYENGKACCTPGGQPIMKLDLPTFFNIFVPVVAAYHKIRTAKLFNDRDLYPLYKYEPLKLTLPNRLKSEIITDRIQRQASEMGYRSDERQSIHQTTLYGMCLNFPMEDWYKEQQLISNGNGKEEKQIIKEGVRFAIPHPSRTFWDMAHRPSTLNSDTGCMYSGYWDIVRYGEIANDKSYWNRDAIAYGVGGKTSSWNRSDAWNLFSMMEPCVMSWPTGKSEGGAGDQDRQNRAFVYSANEKDSAVLRAPYFCKVVPKDWDLFDYEYPIWMRLIFASDETVIWGKPLAYSPNVCYLYDADQNRAFNSSLGLELLPWQDHLGNYLTQYLLSVKKNLEKVVFWNAEVLDEEKIKEIRNLGEKIYRQTTFIPYSDRELKWQQTSVAQAFYPVSFPLVNTQEISAAVITMLNVMERMLGFSSQELGSPASHEQSATEINIVSLNTSVRLEFTGGHIDDGIKARKKLLYDAMMAYSSDEVFAEVADLNDAKKKALDDMGFKIEDEEQGIHAKAGVRGSKKGLKLEGFASDREGPARIQDSKVATAMLQAFQTVFANPLVIQEIGVKQLVDLFNQILPFLGIPKDWRLRSPTTGNAQQQAEAMAQQMAQMQKAIGDQTVQVAGQVVDQELTKFAEVIKKEVIEPQAALTQGQEALVQGQVAMQEEQKNIGDAVLQLVRRAVESDQKDGVQDQAIAKLAQLFEIAAQPQPVPVPVPVVEPNPYAESIVGAAPISPTGEVAPVVVPAGAI